MIANAVADLSPRATLFVLLLPFIALLPLKFLEVYFLTTHNWLGAAAIIIAAKVVGLGIIAFIFDVTRDKLLQMAWFRRLYEWTLRLRQWAHDITAPVRERVRQLVWLLKPQRAGRFARQLVRLGRHDPCALCRTCRAWSLWLGGD